jgi:predicted nucleic acid-binding protein
LALIDDVGEGPVGVDTAVFIYLIEENEIYLPIITPLFEAADSGRVEIVVSSLTLLEVLVVPYRAGNTKLAETYEAVLTEGRGIRLVELGREQLRRAAHLRATTGVATPDSLQLATSLVSGCSAFVTNDRRLPAIPSLRILQLDAYRS